MYCNDVQFPTAYFFVSDFAGRGNLRFDCRVNTQSLWRLECQLQSFFSAKSFNSAPTWPQQYHSNPNPPPAAKTWSKHIHIHINHHKSFLFFLLKHSTVLLCSSSAVCSCGFRVLLATSCYSSFRMVQRRKTGRLWKFLPIWIIVALHFRRQVTDPPAVPSRSKPSHYSAVISVMQRHLRNAMALRSPHDVKRFLCLAVHITLPQSKEIQNQMRINA